VNLSALLQLADSGFPSGAFAHSFGLETAIDEHRVTDGASLEAWLRAYLTDSLTMLDGGAMALTFAGADPSLLDDVVSAATFAQEARAANAALARATLEAYDAFALSNERITRYRAAVACGDANGIAAIAAALGYEAAGIPCAQALQAFFSTSLAALAAAAARAVPLGQRAICSVLWSLRADIEQAARASLTIERPAQLHAQAFEQEIDALAHSRLNGRLFAS
jgi:urease accessory protein